MENFLLCIGLIVLGVAFVSVLCCDTHPDHKQNDLADAANFIVSDQAVLVAEYAADSLESEDIDSDWSD